MASSAPTGSTMPPKLFKPETLLSDIRRGLTDAEVMAKYEITHRVLKNCLKALLESGAISKAEFERRPDYFFKRIKKLTIVAMFSDDDLMNKLVLKGGNALDIAYAMNLRSSIDLDFSIESEFDVQEIDIIRAKIEKCLRETFLPEGYAVFDITFVERPPEVSADMANFWGGYRIEFKLIDAAAQRTLGNDPNSLRRHAEKVDPSAKKRFRIDISKFEYCAPKKEKELDHYTIFVYSPEHIVVEKIRSICQQMPEYGRTVKSQSQSARPKDFFDIYCTMEHFGIDLTTLENLDLVRCSFRAKRVPLELIGKISEYRDYHRQGFDAVKDTVYPWTKLQVFDFYFDYVVERCEPLKALWEE